MTTENMKIGEYLPTEAALEALRGRMAGVVYDVTTTAGMDSARKDRRELVSLRTALEAKRVEIKAPALARCKMIDTEAARIKGEILKLETPIDEQIKKEEERKAQEKREREEAERKRVEKIQGMIAGIKAFSIQAAGRSAEDIQSFMDSIRKNCVPTAEDFAEYLPMAEAAVKESLEALKQLYDVKAAEEQEAERTRLENEARERQRIEKEKELAAEQEKLRLEREAFEAEKRKANEENERKERELQAERERLAAIEKEKRDKEEAERLESQRIENERLEKERLERERIEREKLEAELAEKERLFNERLQEPYQAIEAILEIATDQTIAAAAARQRIIQAAETALKGRG